MDPFARRHRCHVGTRPAPVPAASHVVPLDVRHARRPQSAGLRPHQAGVRLMTETTSAPTETTESVEEFATRARTWLGDNMPRIDPGKPPGGHRGGGGPGRRARA